MSKYLVSDPPPPPVPPGPPRRRPAGGDRRSGGHDRVPLAIGALLIVLGLFFGFLAYRMVRNHTSFSDSIVSMFVPAPEQVFGKDRIYTLILGIDYDYTATDQPYSGHSRSDTIMVAGIDFPSKSAHLVSVLRDTAVMVNGRLSKINEAYSEGGIPLADKVIGNFLGMPALPNGRYFDRYVVVRVNALKDLVNAIGGIDVPVTETMNYDDSWGHLHIHFKPGLVHMNGDQAQAYARFRHDACSDPCRTRRQQQVIHIVIAKLKAEKFNDLAHVAALLDVFKRDVDTNLSFDELKSLAWSFKDASPADLGHADTIGYTGLVNTWEGQAVVADQAQKDRIVAGLLGPYLDATPLPSGALVSVKPATIHLVIENGSGIPGLAKVYADKLRRAGYVVDGVQNADAFGYAVTQIRPTATNPAVGERVRTDVGIADAVVSPATDATPGPHPVVTVIVGKDAEAAH